MNLEKEIFEISLVDIMPNRFQPREIFDDEALRELAESIKTHGVIQPIIVRKVGDKYEIIAGERRYRASQLAGKKTIPALVRDIDDKEAAKIALLENLQRKDLSPIEEAKTYQTILKLENITQEELAKNLGKSQSAIANKLRLLSLDEEVQTALLNAQISERHARSLLNVDSNKQKELLRRIINERLTVKQVDEEIMRISGKMPESNYEGQNEEVDFNKQSSINLQPNISSTPINPVLPTTEPPQTEVKQETIINPIIENKINNVQETTTELASEKPINLVAEQEQVPIEQTPEIEKKEIESPKNIFDSLRVNSNFSEINRETKQEEPIINNEENINPAITTNYNSIYDLRFAINNFRQAVQNTEKFGFKVKAEEKDTPDTYQIIINIDKNN